MKFRIRKSSYLAGDGFKSGWLVEVQKSKGERYHPTYKKGGTLWHDSPEAARTAKKELESLTA